VDILYSLELYGFWKKNLSEIKIFLKFLINILSSGVCFAVISVFNLYFSKDYRINFFMQNYFQG
jgi:hypothetical protein